MSRAIDVQAPPAEEEPPPKWCWRDIQWRQVFARQDYANFCLTACLIVAAAVVSAAAEPHVVPYVLWDARISYPLNSEVDTIPAWAAVFGPLMMLLLTVLVGELLASRRQHASVTDAVGTTIYFFLDGVQSFVMGILLTQVFKVMVGRLRPNFLARCQPIVPPNTEFNLATAWQAEAYATQQWPCANPSAAEEGRKAFPSGHTSASFNLAVYASGYLIWEFKADLLNVLAKAWMLGMLCFAWGVGISRIIGYQHDRSIIDYQHDPSDVVGAALLGTMVALVYLLRAIPRWRRVVCSNCAAVVSHYGTMASSTGDVEAPIVRRDGSAKQRSGGGAADVGGGTAGVTL